MNSEIKSQLRSIAIKKSIKEIHEGTVITEETGTSYFLTKTQEKINRINNLSIIVNKQKQGIITDLLVDDGTATIYVKLFEEKKEVDKLSLGSAILLIAKIRIFNQVKYLAPEIIKNIDPLWIKVQSVLFGLDDQIKKNEPNHSKEITISEPLPIKEKKYNEVTQNKRLEESKFPFEKLIELIKQLDSGEGVAIEEILEKSPVADTEKLIDKMLENGDVFQNLPGRIKVL